MSWRKMTCNLIASAIGPIAAFAIGFALNGCGPTTMDPDGGMVPAVCMGVVCGHGACIDNMGTAECMCDTGWVGDTSGSCTVCADNFTGAACDTCAGNFTGAACDTCATGWAGAGCDTCAANFTGASCDTCAGNFTGAACDTCAGNFAGAACDTCATGWAGAACDTCATGFAGAACDTCDVGYIGDCMTCASGYIPNPSMIGECAVGLSLPTTDLVLWLDAANAGTDITFAGASGNDVAAWADKVDGSPVLANATAAARPLYDNAGLNGMPTVEFDGSNDVLSAIDFVGLNGTNVYKIFIAGYSSVDDDGCFMEGVSAGGDLGLRLSSGFSNRAIFIHDGNFDVNTATDSDALTANTLTLSRLEADVMTFGRWAGPVHGIRVNGDPQFLGTAVSGAFTSGFSTLRLGSCAGARRLTGKISEVLVFDRELTSNEINDVENYLHAKWAIPKP